MKKQIRKEMKSIRAAMSKTELLQKSKAAVECFLKSDIYKNSKVLMLYMPLGNETDTRDIIRAAFGDGKKVVLPVTDGTTGIITPCYYEENTVLEKGGFSVTEPQNAKVAEKSEIDVVIVPGIAFDKLGSRVGFGKGCYDMFLEDTEMVKVGFCYDFQMVDVIPADEHDVKMDFIVTEKRIFKSKS